MTDLLGNVDLDKLKPGDVLRVVPHGKKDLRLEKIEARKTVPVLLNIPKGLHRVWLTRATLFDNPLDEEILETLDEVMEGWIGEAAGDEFEIVYKKTRQQRTKDKGKK